MFKKEKQDFSSLCNLLDLLLDNNKVNISNIINTKGELKTWFWHESANKSDSDSEKEGYSNVNIKKSN